MSFVRVVFHTLKKSENINYFHILHEKRDISSNPRTLSLSLVSLFCILSEKILIHQYSRD